MNKEILQVVPDIPSGYELDKDGWFEVVIPEESTNYFIDPANWYILPEKINTSSVISQNSNVQRRGRYGIETSYTNNGHTKIGLKKFINIPSEGIYTFSFDLKGDYQYSVYVQNSVETFTSNPTIIKGIGDWKRYSFTIELPAAQEYYFFIETNNLKTFYTDGFQCENKAYDTTYFDGNASGYLYNDNSYKWNGKNKYTSTSSRSLDTGSGGKKVNFNDYGLQIVSVSGIGLPSYSINSTKLSSGGSFYQGSSFESREFSLVAQLTKDNLRKYLESKKELEHALFVERTSVPQEITLRFHISKNGANSKVVNIPCIYSSGLEGDVKTNFGERVVLVFQQTRPMLVEEGNKAQELDVSTCFEDGYYYIAKHNDDDTWEKMGDGFNDEVLTILVDTTNQNAVYAGGKFTQSGIDTVRHIAKWNSLTEKWEEIGASGLDGDVYAIREYFYIDYWGDIEKSGIVIGGAFSESIALYNATTDTITDASMTGFTGTVYDILVDSDVILYVGNFDVSGSTHNNICYSLAKDGHTIQYPIYYEDDDTNDGIDGVVYALTEDSLGNVYAGGEFTDYPSGAGTSDLNRFIKIIVNLETDVTGYYAVTEDTIDDTIYALASDDAGNIYLGGKFTSPYNLIAKWTGLTLEEVGGGLYDSVLDSPYVCELIFLDNRLYASGDFNYSGDGKYFYNSVAYFYKTNWHNINVKLPGFSIINTMARDGNKVYLGFSSEGKIIKPIQESITNEGNTTYPKVLLYYPFILSLVTNNRSEQLFEVNEQFTIGASNAVMLDFERSIFISELRGFMNISGGSERIFLTRGENNLSILPIANVPTEIDYGSQTNLISLRWISGIESTNVNSDNELSLKVVVSGGNYTQELYNDTTLVGHTTSQATTDKTAEIVADNDSGLTGMIFNNNPQNTTGTYGDITIKFLLDEDVTNPAVIWNTIYRSIDELVV